MSGKHILVLLLALAITNVCRCSLPKSVGRGSKSLSYSQNTALHIGGLFPISGTSGWLGGQGTYPGE